MKRHCCCPAPFNWRLWASSICLRTLENPRQNPTLHFHQLRWGATAFVFSSFVNSRRPCLPCLALLCDRFFWMAHPGLVSLLFLKPNHCHFWAPTHLLWKDTCFSVFIWRSAGFAFHSLEVIVNCCFINILTYIPAHSTPQPLGPPCSPLALCDRELCPGAHAVALFSALLLSNVLLVFSRSENTETLSCWRSERGLTLL